MKTEIAINMESSSIGRLSFAMPDMRSINLCNATIGIFDARGKSLTVEFLTGAKFGELDMDGGTRFFTQEGKPFPRNLVQIVEEDGYRTFRFAK